jgi:hypothetical protein
MQWLKFMQACGSWFICSTRRYRAGSPAASRRWSGRTRASSSSSRPFLADGAAGDLSIQYLPVDPARVIKGPFGKALAPASLALDPDPREELILLILLENQNHF